MSIVQKPIPFSEILSYLSQIEKRHFESLNHGSRRLLLSLIKKLIVRDDVFSPDQLTNYLEWLRHNGVYMSGLTEIYVYVTTVERLRSVISVLADLDYPVLTTIDISGYTRRIPDDIPFVRLFSKFDRVHSISITFQMLRSISEMDRFRFVRSLELTSIGLEGAHDFFGRFLQNNSWRYLSHVKLGKCNTNMFVVFSECMMRDKSPLRSIVVQSSTIIARPIITKYMSFNKKLRKVHLFDAVEDFQLMQLFLTDHLLDFACDNASERLLHHIGQTCTSLRELHLYTIHCSRNRFVDFILHNKLTKLTRLTVDSPHILLGTDLKMYLPSITTLVLPPTEVLDRDQSIRFFETAGMLESIEFATTMTATELCVYLRGMKQLCSLTLHDVVLGMDDFILLMNVLPLHQMKQLYIFVSDPVLRVFIPFLLRMEHIVSVTIFYLHPAEHYTRQAVQADMLYALHIIQTLGIRCTTLETLNVIANIDNNDIQIPHHRRRFTELKAFFPRLESIQLGWGAFHYH